jgi:hypothetical protein
MERFYLPFQGHIDAKATVCVENKIVDDGRLDGARLERLVIAEHANQIEIHGVAIEGQPLRPIVRQCLHSFPLPGEVFNRSLFAGYPIPPASTIRLDVRNVGPDPIHFIAVAVMLGAPDPDDCHGFLELVPTPRKGDFVRDPGFFLTDRSWFDLPPGKLIVLGQPDQPFRAYKLAVEFLDPTGPLDVLLESVNVANQEQLAVASMHSFRLFDPSDSLHIHFPWSSDVYAIGLFNSGKKEHRMRCALIGHLAAHGAAWTWMG